MAKGRPRQERLRLELFLDTRFWADFDPEKRYRPSVVAEKFEVSVNTIYTMINLGELKSVKIRGSRRIPGWSIIEYIKENCDED